MRDAAGGISWLKTERDASKTEDAYSEILGIAIPVSVISHLVKT